MAHSPDTHWQRLSLLTGQFRANVNALTPRYPSLAHKLLQLPATTKLVSTAGAQLHLADQINGRIREIADPAPPAAARQIAAKVYPTGSCTFPLVVAGLGFGWIWQQLYAMPVTTPMLPGHRPPLYLMAGDIGQLHAILHVHDWRTMLADERAQLFVGADAFEQLERSLLIDTRLPWPKLAVTVEPSCWPAGKSLDGLVQSLFARGGKRLNELAQRNLAAYAGATASAIAGKIESGAPLRILGITSRYTTFLQHSMRDWLDAFSRLGHRTKLLIEHADHEVMNNIVYAEACADFRPDLVVLIDHYRAELRAIPDNIPCVMWIQDRLPNIFNASAGPSQTQRDYVLGFGRQECVDDFGYPHDRFLPTRIGVNADRFAPRQLEPGEIDRFACDVSYVSHAGATADAIISDTLAQRASPDARRLIGDIFDRFRGIYDSGDYVTEAADVKDLIHQSMAETKTAVADITPLVDLFLQRVNNALFRHQTLAWLAELDIDLRIYGKGWESHPTLARFARGVADNQSELCAIYQASRINLQATPHGAVHQRLTDGLSAGGFFLIRYTPADVVENVYRPIWDWCVNHGVRSDEDLKRRATPEISARLAQLAMLKKGDPFSFGVPLVTSMALAADGDYTCSAGSIWAEYGKVSFDSAEKARQKVTHYLASADQRRAIATSMRQRVLDRLTYTAITRRLLGMISANLAKHDATTPTARAA
ncbi:MAG: glycosyltransferase [Tepidisphaeraceae bacterium]